MHVIKKNFYGGVDIHNEKGKFLLHLDSDDLMKIYAIQQNNYDFDTVRARIPDWVIDQHENDACFLADFNSHLFSDDEISSDEISSKILGDEKLVSKIVADYRTAVENDDDWFVSLNKAIENNVSIKDILGEILQEKHPKELFIGKWRVAVVEKGDFHGERKNLQHEDDKPVVEFFDMSVDEEVWPNGQFTSGRYYLDTLLSSEWGLSLDDRAKAGVCLELCGGVDAWVVSPGDLNVIGAWLYAVRKHMVLEQAKDVKVRYCGDVDVPFGYGYVAGLKYDVIPAKFAAAMLKSRLSAIPEFDTVNVEQFGEYDGGFGFNFSFFTTVDDITAQALLKHVLSDLKYEVYRDGSDVSFENTLVDAQERSRQQGNDTVPNKTDKELGE